MPLLQLWPSKLINCGSIHRAQHSHMMSPKGEGIERRREHPQWEDSRLLPTAPLTSTEWAPRAELSEQQKKVVAKSLLDEHSCTCSFWHLFIIKDNLTWMAGETAHLLLKIGFISFSQQYARAEWCFKNIPRHSANTGAFPYPTGQG